jgi:hypothetical protein
MMKRLIPVLLILFSLPVFAENTVKQIMTPNDWLSQKALKVGFVISFTAAQSFSGFIEGYSFGGRDVVGENAYHVFRTGRDLVWLTAGYLGYATVTNKRQNGWVKVRRILGTACIGRNSFEWSYRAQRYGNIFCYDTDKNRHSIVYFGIRHGKLTDCYIGTGPFTGPLVDMIFLGLGIYLLGD